MTFRNALLIFILSLLTISVYLLRINPISSFEVSFYSETGWLVWVLLASGITLLLILITIVYFRNMKSNRAIPTEFWVLFIAYLIILFAPFIRGYTTYGRSDLMVHIGYIEDLLIEKPITNEPYPAVHVLLGLIISIAGIIPQNLVKYTSLFIYLIYWGGIYLLAGQCFTNNNQRLFSMFVGMPLLFSFFHIEVLPYNFSASMIPFIVYVWIKTTISSKSIIWRVIWIATCLAVSLFHPLVAIYIASAILFSGLMKLAGLFLKKRSLGISGITSKPTVMVYLSNSALIILIILFIWLWKNWGIWELIVRQSEISISKGFLNNSFDVNYQQAQLLSLTLIDIVIVAIKMFGQFLLYTFLSVILSIIIIFRSFNDPDKNPALREVALLYMGLLLGDLVAFISGLGLLRLMVIPIGLSSTLFSSLISFNYFHVKGIRKMVLGSLLLIIIIININAMLVYYQDPYTNRVNSQSTQAELSGMQWFFMNKERYPSRTLTWRLRQFSAFLLGSSFEASRTDIGQITTGELPANDHFDFPSDSSLVNTPMIYLPISKYDRAYHLDVFRSAGRFLNADFEKISKSPWISLIYSNGDLEIYLVQLRHQK